MTIPLSVLKAVQAVQAFKIDRTQQFFAYIAVSDENVCPVCRRYDQGLMTRREIVATFPYLDRFSDNTWFPAVHPNCRCVLLLFESVTDAVDTQELTPRERVEQALSRFRSGVAKTNENGDPLLKDGIFDDLIAGLIASGVIVAGWSWREKKRARRNMESHIFTGEPMTKQEIIEYLQTVPSKHDVWRDIYGLLKTEFEGEEK